MSSFTAVFKPQPGTTCADFTISRTKTRACSAEEDLQAQASGTALAGAHLSTGHIVYSCS
jgi:hypothetical protein